MSEEAEPKETPFDAEWEIRKFGRRLLDIMDIIDELKAKDKSLSARISRLRLASIEEEDEDQDDREAKPQQPQSIEDLSIEERALLAARLLDQDT